MKWNQVSQVSQVSQSRQSSESSQSSQLVSQISQLMLQVFCRSQQNAYYRSVFVTAETFLETFCHSETFVQSINANLAHVSSAN